MDFNLIQPRVSGPADDENADTNDDGQHSDSRAQLVEILLQWRLVGRGVWKAKARFLPSASITVDELCDAANACVHTGVRDEAFAKATGDAATGEGHGLWGQLLWCSVLLLLASDQVTYQPISPTKDTQKHKLWLSVHSVLVEQSLDLCLPDPFILEGDDLENNKTKETNHNMQPEKQKQS